MPVQPNELAWNAGMIADFQAHAGEISEGRLAGGSFCR